MNDLLTHRRFRSTTIAALVLALVNAPRATAQTVYDQGQINFMELAFDNSVPNDPRWLVSVFNETTNESFLPIFNSGLNRWVFAHPTGVLFHVAGPQHLWTRPADASWNFTGVAANESFRATPQNGDPATRLIFGISSLFLPNNLFVNNSFSISLSLSGVNNPGDFSLYNNDDGFNDALGIPGPVLLATFTNTLSFSRLAGTINNFNLAFSEPGIYELDFQFSGLRTDSAGGGVVTSDLYRYTFVIAPVPEPAVIGLLVGVGGILAALGYRYRRRRLWTAEQELFSP